MEKEFKLDKLSEVLKKYGLSEEEIKSVESELSEEPKVEEPSEKPVEVDAEQPSEESLVAEEEAETPKEEESAEPVESEPSEEVESESEPVESETEPEPESVGEEPVEVKSESEEPVSEESVEEVEESKLPEGVEEVAVGEESVSEPVKEQKPVFDPQELLSRLEESEKARAGLEARLGSLETALKEAGIMKNSESTGVLPVGVDDSTRVPDFHDDESDLESTIARLNRNRY